VPEEECVVLEASGHQMKVKPFAPGIKLINASFAYQCMHPKSLEK
jgi:hypothetical protein